MCSTGRWGLFDVVFDDGQEVRLYCFSEERAAKDRGIVEQWAESNLQFFTFLIRNYSPILSTARPARAI